MTASNHHEINYIEFAVSNMDEAKRFYTAAFDWQFTDYSPEYAGIQKRNSDGEAGGIYPAESVTTGVPWSFSTQKTLNNLSSR